MKHVIHTQTGSRLRRQTLKLLGIGSAVASSKALPDKWVQPVIDSVILPTHAQATTDTPRTTTTQQTATGTIYAGDWSGQWTNTTFGSSGPLTMKVTDNGDGTADVTTDLGGMVGGLLDPDPVTITANINLDGSVNYSGTIAMLGPLTFSVSSGGAINASAPAIPLVGFSSFVATGNISPNSGSLNYTVSFSPAGSASGTASASKA